MKTAKSIVIIFIGVFALVVAVSYWNYRVNGLSRATEDRTTHFLTRANAPDIHTIVLGDSVINVATREFLPADGVAIYTTVGSLRLAGQFFLARRYLQNNKPKRIVVGIVPEHFWRAVDNEGERRVRHTYSDTLFWAWDERFILKQSTDDRPWWASAFYDVLLKSWRSPIHNMQEPPRRAAIPAAVHWPTVGIETHVPSDNPTRAAQFRDGTILPQNKYLLQAFNDLCKEHQVECILVLEPAPKNVFVFGEPSYRKFNLNYPNLKFVDLNFENGQPIIYPDHAFYDGLHFSGVWNEFYASLLNNRVAPIFKTPTPWDGRTIAIDQAATKLEFYDAFQYEKNGRWVSAKPVHIQFNAGFNQQPTALMLKGRGVLNTAIGPQRLKVEVNGADVGTMVFNVNWEMHMQQFSLPPNALKLGAKNEIVLTPSYATAPRDVDKNSDDMRHLAVFLTEISLFPQ